MSSRWRHLNDDERFDQHTRSLLNNTQGMGGRFGLFPPVYYGEHKTTGQVKIGTSVAPAKRCAALGCRLLAVEVGEPGARGRPLEGQRLRQFTHARIPGTLEWFDGSDVELRHWISQLAKAAS